MLLNYISEANLLFTPQHFHDSHYFANGRFTKKAYLK